MANLQFQEYKLPNRSTLCWLVECKNIPLGKIEWYNHWRRYCFYPMDKTLFDLSCLKEITEFIDAEMQEHKSDLKLRKALK